MGECCSDQVSKYRGSTILLVSVPGDYYIVTVTIYCCVLAVTCAHFRYIHFMYTPVFIANHPVGALNFPKPTKLGVPCPFSIHFPTFSSGSGSLGHESWTWWANLELWGFYIYIIYIWGFLILGIWYWWYWDHGNIFGGVPWGTLRSDKATWPFHQTRPGTKSSSFCGIESWT